ncbi:MAG: metal ABC transporter permease [Pseudomonadota bacterium]
MIDVLVEPFGFPFMQSAFLISALVAIPTAILSCFLVLRGWALMGDAISHAVLPGIVIAYVTSIPLILGAFAAGMLCAVATGYLADNSRVKEDTVMGVVFSGMFGLGIVLFVAFETTVDLDHILFGNMLGVEPHELWRAGVISAVVAGGLLLSWRDLVLHAFDPAQARVSGLRTGLLHYGLLAAVALTVVAVLTATGLILAIGLMIAPGAIGFLLARSFAGMMAVSVVAALAGMLGGTYLSFYLDAAPAPTIVLVLTAIFLAALAVRIARVRRAQARAI